MVSVRTSRIRWKIHLLWVVPLALMAGIYAPKAWAAARGFYTRLAVLSTIVRLAREVYVDPVDTEKLMDGAIDGLLDRLDPHSNYLSPEQAEELEARLRGHFGGVGIQYSIIEGIPTVISTIEGSPAERAGLLTGDRIIAVDGVTTAGWRESEVREHLRGPMGTKVTVTVERIGEEEPLHIDIVRGDIKLKSVPYAFMLDDSTGYLRISYFSQTTGQEVGRALGRLAHEGMRVLILDLRGNGGGDLEAAVAVCNYFLPEGTIIVSQRGRWQAANHTYYATAGPLKFLHVPLVVMINHGSASASEIVAGALQDTDRGIVVGQRSFGKGLVQRQFDLSRQVTGGGVLLLTVARYYTPTGRLIQRDYTAGTMQYVMEGLSDHASADTAKGPAYTTPLGRIVYGGGGIHPDYVLPPDRVSQTVSRLAGRAAFFRFAEELIRQGWTAPQDFPTFQRTFAVDHVLWEKFTAFAQTIDAQLTRDALTSARDELVPFIAAGIAGRLWGPEARYRVLAPSDAELRMARAHLADATRLLQAAAVTRGAKNGP